MHVYHYFDQQSTLENVVIFLAVCKNFGKCEYSTSGAKVFLMRICIFSNLLSIANTPVQKVVILNILIYNGTDVYAKTKIFVNRLDMHESPLFYLHSVR